MNSLNNDLNDQKQSFEKKGYFVIRNLLNKNEVKKYLDIISAYNDLNSKWDIPDGITKNENFWGLIVNEKLVASLRSIVGDVKYTQHSDILVNTTGVSWHRDSAYREFGVGPDWDEKNNVYGIVRVAIYLHQKTLQNPFKLGFIQNSHTKEYWHTKYEIILNNLVNTLLRKLGLRLSLVKPLRLKVDMLDVNSGDCIIFDQRLYHSPNDYRENKIALFLSYGLNNYHSFNHLKYYRKNRKDLGYLQIFPKNLKKKLLEENLLINVPEDYNNDQPPN